MQARSRRGFAGFGGGEDTGSFTTEKGIGRDDLGEVSWGDLI